MLTRSTSTRRSTRTAARVQLPTIVPVQPRREQPPHGERMQLVVSIHAMKSRKVNRHGQHKGYPHAGSTAVIDATYAGFGPRGGEYYTATITMRKPGGASFNGTMRLYVSQIEQLLMGWTPACYVDWRTRRGTLVGTMRLVQYTSHLEQTTTRARRVAQVQASAQSPALRAYRSSTARSTRRSA